MSDDLRADTSLYVKRELTEFVSVASQRFDFLKKGDSLKFTILAYKGLITRATNAIEAVRTVDKNADVNVYRERINRYGKILENLRVVAALPFISDPTTLENDLLDLRMALKVDTVLRGEREQGVQPIIKGTIAELRSWTEGVNECKDVAEAVEEDDADKVLSDLKALRGFLLQHGLDTKEIDDLIRRWTTNPPERLKEVVYLLFYGIQPDFKEGQEIRQDNKPAGAYVLFNVDFKVTTPEKFFGTMIHRDKDTTKDNIYYWFKRKFQDNVASREWEEKKSQLDLEALGYVSNRLTEIVVKYGKGYTYPLRIVDTKEAARQYLIWKEAWKRRLGLTETGWQGYVNKLNEYYF